MMRAGKGMIPPRVVVERLLTQLDTQRTPTPDQSPLLAAFRSMPASIPQAEQQRLQKAATEAYTQAFQPAWQKYRNYVADAYLPKARASVAMSTLPDGKEFYALSGEAAHHHGHDAGADPRDRQTRNRPDHGGDGRDSKGIGVHGYSGRV